MEREQQKGLGALRNQAVQAGAFGGGREAAMMGEYQASADMARAMQEAQMRQQGFESSQAASASTTTSTTRFRYVSISTWWYNKDKLIKVN